MRSVEKALVSLVQRFVEVLFDLRVYRLRREEFLEDPEEI